MSVQGGPLYSTGHTYTFAGQKSGTFLVGQTSSNILKQKEEDRLCTKLREEEFFGQFSQ
jgi:hypothetical protein